jgi:hypothetical protein
MGSMNNNKSTDIDELQIEKILWKTYMKTIWASIGYYIIAGLAGILKSLFLSILSVKIMYRNATGMQIYVVGQMVEQGSFMFKKLIIRNLTQKTESLISLYENNKQNKIIDDWDYPRLLETLTNIFCYTNKYDEALKIIEKRFLLNIKVNDNLYFDSHIVKYHLSKTKPETEEIATFFLDRYKNNNDDLYSLIAAAKIIFTHELFDITIHKFVLNKINTFYEYNIFFILSDKKVKDFNKFNPYTGTSPGLNIKTYQDFNDLKIIFKNLQFHTSTRIIYTAVTLYTDVFNKDYNIFNGDLELLKEKYSSLKFHNLIALVNQLNS